MEDTSEKTPPVSGSRVHAIESGVDHRWAALFQAVATRMVKYLDRSENLAVDIKVLEYFLLAPDEPNVEIKHIALHARGDRQKYSTLSLGREGTKSVWRVQHVGMKILKREAPEEFHKVHLSRNHEKWNYWKRSRVWREYAGTGCFR